MPLLGKKKLGKPTSSDFAASARSDVKQSTKQATEKAQASESLSPKTDAPMQEDLSNVKKAAPSAVAASAPSTPSKASAVPSSAPTLPESTSSHARSHSFDLRRKLRMPSNRNLGNKSPFGFRRVRTGTDTLTTSEDTATAEAEQAATPETSKAKAPGPPGGFSLPMNSSSLSLRPFRSKDSAPQTPKRGAKGKEKAREDDTVPPVPMIDPERFPNLASKTPQAAPRDTNTLSDDKLEVVLLPRFPTSGVPATPSASSQRAVTSPVYSELSRTSPHVPFTGGPAPSISGAGLNLSTFSSPTSPPAARPEMSPTSSRLPPYLMETLSLEPSKRILTLQSSSIEAEERDASVLASAYKEQATPVKDASVSARGNKEQTTPWQGPSEADTSGLAGFMPPKVNPLSYLFGSKDSKSGGADESTATMIQRSEEPDLANEDEESIDGTQMSHAATVMYDADDFLDANSAVEAHDAEDTWYDPSDKEAGRAARSSQAFRQMPGSVPSDFGHTEQPASLTAAAALKETLPVVHEDENSVRAPSSDPLNKALPVPAAVEEPKLATPAAEPVDEEALTSSMGDETTTEPQQETKPTLLGSLSDAITTAASASSAGIAMLVGQRDKTPGPEAKPVADAETPSSASPLSMVKPPVPPRMRPLMSPTENESDTVPAVADAEPESKEEPASDNIVPVVPLSLPSKSATPASEMPLPPVPTNTEEAAPATTEPGVEQAMEEGHAVSSGPLAEDSETGVSTAPVAVHEPALEQPAPVSNDEDAKPLDLTTEQADVLAAKPAPESQLTEPVSERDTEAVTELSSPSNVVAASVPEPTAEPATEPALEPALPVVTEPSTAPVSEEPTTAPAPAAESNETEAPPIAPTPLAEAAPSDEAHVPAEPSESAPAKVPVAQPVPFPASSQGTFAWAPAPSFTKESRLPQLPPVLGSVPDVPLKDEPLEASTEAPLPTVPAKLPPTLEPAADEAAPTPAPLVSEPAAPKEPNVAESTADESSHRGIKRLSNVLSGGLLSSAALPAFLRKKDEPASQDEQADKEAAPPALPEKPRDSMLVPEPEPEPVSAPTVPAVSEPATEAPAAPIPEDVSAREPPASAPAVANVGLPWSYVAPTRPAPESEADESARVPATQPSVPLAPVATEQLMASEPESEADESARVPATQPSVPLAPVATEQLMASEPVSEPVHETTADVVKWQQPVWPVAAREEAPLPDTPADTSASQGPLPWNLATTSFLPSAQTRFFESEHQLPHWHAPTESATGARAPVDGAWSLPKLASEPVVAPDAVDEEPDMDWDLEQPSRRYATDVEGPPAEREPPFLQTVPEEQGEAPADTTVPEAEDRDTADPSYGRTEEDVKPAPALRGKGVYDPEMLNHFMHAMDESDYGRAVHRASTLGVPLEEIPSDTPAPATQSANEPPRPSELFAGKGVRWDSPDWLRSRLHKVEGPSQQDFQAFLKKRRQIVPAFVWRDAESSLEDTKALEASKTPQVTTEDEAPTTATTSSLLADWEQNESQPADARFSKLLLPADSYLLSDSEPIDTSLLSLEQLEKSYQGKARSPDPAWGGAPTLAPPAEDVPPAVPPKSHLGHGPLRTTQAASMPASPARQPDVELAQHLEQARRRQAAQYEQYDREQARLQQRVSVMPPPNDGHEFYDEFGGTRPLYEMEGRVPEEARPTAAPPPPEPDYESATPTYPAHGPHDVPPSQADQGYHGAAYAHAGYPQSYAQPDYASQGFTQPGHGRQGYAEQGYPQPGYAPQGYAPQGYAPQGYGPHYGYADPQYAQYGYPSQQEIHASYAQPPHGWDAYGHPNAYPSAYPDPNPPVDVYGASQASMPSPMDATQPRVAPSVSLTPLSRLGIPPAHQFSDSPFPTATSGPLSVGRDPMDMPFKPPTPKKGSPFRQGASPASLPGDVPVAPRHHGYASSARSAQFGRSTHRSRASGSRSGWNALLNADLYRSS
ncbi:hypothetical protein MEQU1_002317 [Malassezia equina]|uniref:Uncharacterized protein n=1 Tax=Malassezia equina TaxID=1381935 RepID=A0AAF0EDN6_9BASI|nr:hypothetical protein MEQU1_002317 [Malassezia equina]